VIPTVSTAFVVWRALATNPWSSWGVEAMPAMTSSSTSFGDLANITTTAQCITDGVDYTACDPYGRPFQPYVVIPARVLAFLGLGADDTGTLGVLLAGLLVLMVAALALVLARNWRAGTGWLIAAQVLLSAVAISPPVMLAVERGQIEILVLALAVAALLALSRAEVAWRALGTVASIAVVVIKFFAIGLYAPFIRRGRPQWFALAGLAVSLVFLVVSWSDIQLASTAARADLPATSKSQFGAGNLIATALTGSPVGYAPDPDIADRWQLMRITGVLLLVAVTAVAAVLLAQRSRLTLDRESAARSLLLGSSGVIVVPYVLGTSHDYRMIFLLPVVVAALIWLSAGAVTWAPVTVLIGATVSMVTSTAMVQTPSGFIWDKWAMVAGDVALLAVLAVAGGLWVRGLVHRA